MSTNDNLLAVMQSLTNAVNGLSNNVQTIQGGGVAAPVSPGVVIPSSPSAPVSQQAAQVALAAQVQAQQQALTEDSASESGGSASLPPNATGTGSGSGSGSGPEVGGNPTSALAWESMMGGGGLLGQYRTAQFQVGGYQNAAQQLLSGVAGTSLFSSPALDEDGNQIIDPTTGEAQTNPNQSLSGFANAIGNSSSLNTAGSLGLTAIGSALDLGSSWADIGQSLGYGHRIGLYGAGTGQEGSYAAAVSQGADIRTGVNDLYRQGMTLSSARNDVTAVTEAGFSDTGPSQGDNTNIASNLVAPLTQQGVSAKGATQWTEALRNAGTNVTALTSSLQNMSSAAQATKQTTDQFNSSLLSFAQSQVASGGTMGQGANTGMDFTAATGMSPTILSTIQSNPVYQGLMMGENGVLPSDIGNLTPGAQLEGVKQMLSMYGGGLSGLNQNKYETVGGVKMVSSYGNSAEAAQVASMTGMTQSEVMRLMNETSGSHFNNVIKAMNVMGNQSGGIDGEGTGLYSILNKSNSWKGLNQHEREQATRVWNAGIGKNIDDMGLSESDIRKIKGTSNVDKRASLLQKDLLGKQKDSALNKITGTVKVELVAKGALGRLVKVVNSKDNAKLVSRAGGTATNNVVNTTSGDAMVANDLSQNYQATTIP